MKSNSIWNHFGFADKPFGNIRPQGSKTERFQMDILRTNAPPKGGVCGVRNDTRHLPLGRPVAAQGNLDAHQRPAPAPPGRGHNR